MRDSPPAVLRPTVRRGPRRGHAEQIVLALPTADIQASEQMLQAYTNGFGSLPEVREVIHQSPRRGKRFCRDLAFMTIRYVRGVKADQAMKLARRTVTRLQSRFSRLTPEVRQERRIRKRAKRQALRLHRQANEIQRKLSPA